jgi:phospholipid/cholesterol/gamma-HCH transport system substrate-binding protein
MIPKLIALAAVALVASGGWLIWTDSRPYEVTAYFLSAERLVAGNDVTMGGVTVGQVGAVQLAPDMDAAGAVVTIQVDRKHGALDRGTRAVIRPKGLLGTMYVELDASHSGQKIPSGGSIPVQDTQSPVSLDQVTDIFDARTRQELQTLTRQGSVALQNRGPDVNKTLQQLPAISANVAATTGALDTRDQQIDQLMAEFDRLAGMVSSEDTSLRGDLTNGATILDTLAQHQAGLQGELQHANSSLGQANSAVGGHEQDVNTLLKELPGLLDQLQVLETTGTTTFATINPCMGDLLTLLAEMRSATGYRQPAGSSDGAGFMLRFDPQLVGPSTGSYSPQAPCSGAGG